MEAGADVDDAGDVGQRRADDLEEGRRSSVRVLVFLVCPLADGFRAEVVPKRLLKTPGKKI